MADEEAFAALRTTLDALKDAASTEDALDFDPSGSSGVHLEASDSGPPSDFARSWHGETESNSEVTQETDLTELSQGLARLGAVQGLGDDAPNFAGGDEEFSQEDKTRILKEMFPSAREYDVAFTLKKLQGNLTKAIEELLNQAFLDGEVSGGETAALRRGIDGFAETAHGSSKKRSKGKKGRKLRRTSSLDEEALLVKTKDGPSPLSRWDKGMEDVEYIVQRTNSPKSTVSSAYHQSGGSLSSTIAILCDSFKSEVHPHLATASAQSLEAHVAELIVDFPTLSHAQSLALIRMAYPSTASAHELARAMLSAAPRTTTSVTPQYATRPPSPPADALTPFMPQDGNSQSSGNAQVSASARDLAYAQAQAAYRKSRSDRLMGGAAAYYSSVAREASASLRKSEAAAADEHVNAQSQPGQVDLHGVFVQDAVRIATRKARAWWESQGMEYAGTGKPRSSGLRVVTGQGLHSEGGRGRLGPAVAKALVADGWKVEIGQGVIDIVGRARR